MIGIKDQCFGVEIELTGITRAEAAEALAAYFETTYDTPARVSGLLWRLKNSGIS
mgnify:CR=1 FL=1